MAHRQIDMKNMRLLLIILVLAVLPAHAQQYTPTKAQHAKLAKERAHIIAMQEKIQDLQNEIQFAIDYAQQKTCKDRKSVV